MSNPKGSVNLRPGSFAQGIRDGWAGKPPRHQADEYMRGYRAGLDEAKQVEWLATWGKPAPVGGARPKERDAA